jgi:hypothetical protein
VARWVAGWNGSQQRAAAQLVDIAAGDRQELAELLVAVRTLRGLHRRSCRQDLVHREICTVVVIGLAMATTVQISPWGAGRQTPDIRAWGRR